MFWFLGSLLANLWRLLFWPWRAWRRSRAAPRGAFVRFELDGALSEFARRPYWLGALASTPALQTVRRVLGEAAEDARVAGVLITIRGLEVGAAMARSLREHLVEAKRRGQRVIVHLPLGGATRETYVASAASLVLLGPQTELAPLGFAVQAQYLKDALDRAGIEPDVFARGRYKTAGERLVLRGMSDPEREQVSRLLDGAYEELVEALSAGRNVERERAEHWVNQGPWTATAALGESLVDQVAYDDELGRRLAPERPEGAPLLSATTYLRRRSLAWRPWHRPPCLAVVDLVGTIASRSGVGLLPFAAEPEFSAAVDRAARDPKVRGVILHVNSPGGGALTSDRMLRHVRKLAEKKPVVAYFGDVAASGGYLVAMGARKIVAQPTAITGSIGVVAARLGFEPLLARMGITTQTLKRGARADFASPTRPLTSEDRRVIEQHIDEVYRAFVQTVAEGRGRPVAEIEPLAGGRVYSGRDALEVGLVDRLGGFETAVEELRNLVGAGAEHLAPVFFGPRPAPLAAVLPRRLSRAVESLGSGAFGASVPLWLDSREERVWLWCGTATVDLGRRV